MNRMFTKQEIIDLINQYSPGFNPAAIEEGDIPQDALLGIADGEIVKGSMTGKYVRIMPAPKSTILTPEEREAIEQGVFIEGDFLGYHNPILTPVNDDGRGLIIGTRPNQNDDGEINTYVLWKHESANPDLIQVSNISVIKFTFNNGFILEMRGGRMYLGGLYRVNGLDIPSYPPAGDRPNRNYHFILSNGSLTWREGNGLYLHTIVFDVGSGQTFTLRFISDSSTPCELDAVTGNFTIPGSTFIQPANMGNVVIVPLDANKFAPDIHAFDSSTGAFTNNITLASVTSDTVTPIG